MLWSLLLACFVVGSGCSVIFESAEPHDGAPSDPADAMIGRLGSSITTSIGPGDDFPDYATWREARKGDLTMRQLVRVQLDGSLLPGEMLTALNGGCEGLVRPASSAALVIDDLLTLDIGTTPCREGDTLMGGMGASITILEAGPHGVKETVRVNMNLIAPVVVDGFMVNESSYLTLRGGKDHSGISGTGTIVRSGASPANGFEIYEDHTRLVNFEITDWAKGATLDNSSFEAVRVQADGVILDRLLIHHDGGDLGMDLDSDGIYAKLVDSTMTVRNSIIHHVGRAGIQFQHTTNSRLNVENCTLAYCMLNDNYPGEYGCVSFYETTDSRLRVVNTVAMRNPADPATQAFTITSATNSNVSYIESTNNASDDGTAPSTDESVPIAITSAVFQIGIGDKLDMHIKSGDLLHEKGIALPYESRDIDGEQRGGLWSIGADEP